MIFNFMLPRLTPAAGLNKAYLSFCKALAKTDFSGEIRTDYAARLAVATDNSIYQLIPQAVVFPRHVADIVAIFQLGNRSAYQHLTFCPRGGGTATNGQALSAGIIIDCSKYMREILELNLAEGWVRVRPGVVLDQLNDFLRPHGYSFAAEISPSNRATVGGMINTDACGIGSKLLGRTSDHIVSLTTVLADGSQLHTSAVSLAELVGLKKQPNRAGEIYKKIADIIFSNQKLISEKFSGAIPRALTGYNLTKTYQPATESFNLNYLLSGSEGTLGLIGECCLKITPLPKYKKLIVIKYQSFQDALRATEISPDLKVIAHETLDEKLLALAKQDSIYARIKDFIADENGKVTQAISLIELASADSSELENRTNHLRDIVSSNIDQPHAATGCYITKDSSEANALWELRKKGVALLSKKLVGTRRPIPFVEDTAVPPQFLADYIADFRKLLDSYHLEYGMYGHLDAGCVHVRPALDMKLAADENLVHEISDKVVALVEKYTGVMWGEHGKGYRSEYAPQFFGPELYKALRQIKTVFDPFNQLNPGKIATPLTGDTDLVKLNGPLRGHFDKAINPPLQLEYAAMIDCNGNGACFNYKSNDPMCPSFKVTQDRIHSPKGRAAVMREWLRQLGTQPRKSMFFGKKLFNTLAKKMGAKDFSHEVHAAMAGCLGCKACATQCPLSVNIPEYKAKFLEQYHTRYFRKLRDYLVAHIEYLTPLQAKFTKFNNFLLKNSLSQFILNKCIGLVDAPAMATPHNLVCTDLATLKQLSVAEREQAVVLLQDVLTSFYETSLLIETRDFLQRLGIKVFVFPLQHNGKPLHVHGYLSKFKNIAHKNITIFRELEKLNLPILGLEPSMTLAYRDEYKKAFPTENLSFTVQLPQEWLANNLDKCLAYSKLHPHTSAKNYYLLSHCTEKTLCVGAEQQWQKIFAAFGHNLMPLPAGCCGMAGFYGHETEHQQHSKALFNMDWDKYISEYQEVQQDILVTGYSCRSQAMRLRGIRMRHPFTALLTDIFNN